MTVRIKGLPTFEQGKDFFRTDRGITWGIKCTSFEGTQFVMMFIRQPDGSWNVNQSVDNMIDDVFDINIGTYANIEDWFNRKLLPKLNVWLAVMFPPLGTTQPPSTTLSMIEQADILINTRLNIVTNPDGTLRAELR